MRDVGTAAGESVADGEAGGFGDAEFGAVESIFFSQIPVVRFVVCSLHVRIRWEDCPGRFGRLIVNFGTISGFTEA